jgi:hypothetical protein
MYERPFRPPPLQISERDATEGEEAAADGQGPAAAASAAADDAGAAAAATSPVPKRPRGADRGRAAVEATTRCVVCWLMPASFWVHCE